MIKQVQLYSTCFDSIEKNQIEANAIKSMLPHLNLIKLNKILLYQVQLNSKQSSYLLINQV